MTKPVHKVGAIGFAAVLSFTLLSPGAEARYPPGIPPSSCIQGVPSRITVGEVMRIRGAKGCALRPNGTLTSPVLLTIRGQEDGVVQSKRKNPTRNGRYRIAMAMLPRSPEGRTAVTIQAGGERFTRFTHIVHPPPPPPPATSFEQFLQQLLQFLQQQFQQFGFASHSGSARVETPSLTVPLVGSLAVLVLGGWFLFAPPRHRRRSRSKKVSTGPPSDRGGRGSAAAREPRALARR